MRVKRTDFEKINNEEYSFETSSGEARFFLQTPTSKEVAPVINGKKMIRLAKWVMFGARRMFYCKFIRFVVTRLREIGFFRRKNLFFLSAQGVLRVESAVESIIRRYLRFFELRHSFIRYSTKKSGSDIGRWKTVDKVRPKNYKSAPIFIRFADNKFELLRTLISKAYNRINIYHLNR